MGENDMRGDDRFDKTQQILCCLVIGIASHAFATEPPITDIAFAPDGKSIATVSQVGVQVFHWPDLKPLRSMDASSANLHCVAFSPDGKRLAVGGGNPAEVGIVEVFSWPACERITSLREHEDSVTSIVWLDATQLFSASFDRTVCLCDVAKGSSLRSYEGHSRGVSSLSLLDDKSTLVSVGDDQSVRVWNSSTGELIRSLSQHTKPIYAVALRPSGSGLPMVASVAGDRTIRFWQPTIGRMVRYIRLKAKPLNIAWTSDGARVLAACEDGRVRVINPVEVTVTQDLVAIDSWAYAIAVHPSDNSVAVGGANGQIRRIKIPDDPQ